MPMLISTLGAVFAVLCIWGFAKNMWSLSLFSLAFGCAPPARIGRNGGQRRRQ
jgi:hypothetical protein